MNLIKVGELGKGLGVSERDIDHSVMNESRKGVHDGRLLRSRRSSGDKGREVFASESSSTPKQTSAIPESLNDYDDNEQTTSKSGT